MKVLEQYRRKYRMNLIQSQNKWGKKLSVVFGTGNVSVQCKKT